MGGALLLVESVAVVFMHGLCAALYTRPLRHRGRYPLRLALCLAAGVVLGFAYWYSGYAAAHLQWWQLLVVFVYVAAMALLLCDQSVFGSLYCATWMMMAQQFFVQIFNTWFTWMNVRHGRAPPALAVRGALCGGVLYPGLPVCGAGYDGGRPVPGGTPPDHLRPDALCGF